MGRRLTALLAAFCLWGASPAWGAAIYFEGSEVLTDVPPQLVEGRFIVPLRSLEAMGDVVVDWREEQQIAVVLMGTPEMVTAVAVPIGDCRAYAMQGAPEDFEAIALDAANVDLSQVLVIALDTPARIVDGRTMVPLHLLVELAGYQVTWEEATETVMITRGVRDKLIHDQPIPIAP